jgi:hypothetical protein
VRRSLGVLLTVAVAVSMAACHSGDPGEPTRTPTATAPSTEPSTEPSTPEPLGTEALVEWASSWKAAFQQFLDDLSAAARAIKDRDLDALGDALGRLPGDAHEAVRKIDEAGAVPPGFEDEVARLRSLADQAANTADRMKADCLTNPGFACAADVATLLSIAAQISDALNPFGPGIDFKIEL